MRINFFFGEQGHNIKMLQERAYAVSTKATRKNSKPPIWRRMIVPSDVTFSQMALVLETLLEIPYRNGYRKKHKQYDRIRKCMY